MSKYNKNKKFSGNSPFLPPISLIEEYESLVPGSTDKIFDMVDSERNHRHQWENKTLTSYIFSYRLGQICGFISILAIIIIAANLAQQGNNEFAKILLFSGLSFHAIIAFISFRGKKFFSRPRKNSYKKYNNKRR